MDTCNALFIVGVLLLVSSGQALEPLAPSMPAEMSGQQITLPGPVFPLVADIIPEHHMPASPQAISSSDVTVLRQNNANDSPITTTTTTTTASTEAPHPVAAAVGALLPRIPSTSASGPLEHQGIAPGTRPNPGYGFPMYPQQPQGGPQQGAFPQDNVPFGYPHANVQTLNNPFKGTAFEQVPFPLNPTGFPYVGTPMGLLGAFNFGTVPVMF